MAVSAKMSSQNNFRIMTYNIRNVKGMDLKTDYRRTANVINRFHPDIVAIQEIDSVTNRSEQRFVLGELSKLTGMHYSYAPAINYDGGKYGIGLLSTEKPLRTHYIALPGREEARVLLIAEFDKFIILVVHLSLTEEDQLTSTAIIQQELKKTKKPVFIAGDFNAHPRSNVMKQISRDFKILTPLENTYPADKPDECLDYIAIDKETYKPKLFQNSFIINEPYASDHRPVVLDVKLEK